MVSVVVYINVLCYGVGCLLTSSLQTIHRLESKGEKKCVFGGHFVYLFLNLGG